MYGEINYADSKEHCLLEKRSIQVEPVAGKSSEKPVVYGIGGYDVAMKKLLNKMYEIDVLLDV